MHTIRQLERYWTSHQYDRLARDLLIGRAENCQRLELECSRAIPATALMLNRLDELQQAHHPINQKLIHIILAAQESDGGWGDPLTSALCLRALMLNRGMGLAIQRGLACLADLQKSNGAWPTVSIRRTNEDPYVTACIIHFLGEHELFRQSVRFDDALQYLARNPFTSTETRRLAPLVTRRFGHAELVHN